MLISYNSENRYTYSHEFRYLPDRSNFGLRYLVSCQKLVLSVIPRIDTTLTNQHPLVSPTDTFQGKVLGTDKSFDTQCFKLRYFKLHFTASLILFRIL